MKHGRAGVAALLLLSGWPLHAADNHCRILGTPAQISLCELPLEGSRFHEYSAQGTLCARMPDVVALLMDVSTVPEWFPDIIEARSIVVEENEALVYLKNRAPWPLRPRDMVYHFVLEAEAEDGSMRVSILGMPDYIDAVPKVVRMESASGSWQLHPVGERTDVRFTMHLELGDVPVFLANRRVEDTVVGAVQNLSERFHCG